MSQEKIAIIGVGNLGLNITNGLIESKFISPENLIITRRNLSSLKKYADQGITITSNNLEAVKKAKIIIIAIKPFQLLELLKDLKPELTEKHLVISVVSGITLEQISSAIGLSIPLYRAMPNLAVAVKQSMTCLCSKNQTLNDKAIVEGIFNSIGKTIFIEENLMNAATVIGSCGIAFAMRFLRANIQGGVEIGFSSTVATQIAAQTLLGAAQLILELQTHPEHEIDRTTTPKGCTIAGLNEMEYNGFSSSLIKGVKASYQRLESPEFVKPK